MKRDDAHIHVASRRRVGTDDARRSTRRRLVITLGCGALSWTIPVLAQEQRRLRRIGFFTRENSQSHAGSLAAFRQGMAELRWVEGRDFVIDARYANSVEHDVARIAAELVATRPDVVLVPADDAVRVLAPMTKVIPIVFASGSDPIGLGFAASLQRPGGNVTGLTGLSRDLAAKRFQIFNEAFPQATHVALLYEPASATSVAQVKEMEAAATRSGVRVAALGVRQTSELEQAFRQGAALGVQGYAVVGGSTLNTQRALIADHLLRAKLPAIFGNGQYVEAGGLMSYAPVQLDNFRRAAAYVDKVLKGAKPGDLPIEQPTKFELVINMKTAKAIGLTLPQSVLLRADRVIE